MILPILTAPNEILSTEAAPIAEVTDEIRLLAKNMRETMHNAVGIGLAAPQVGRSLRLFTIESEEDEIPYTVFINPRLTWKSLRSRTDEEGCLSVPGLYGPVRRPSEVRVKALNLNGEIFELRTSGLFARAIQHENDHLQGILFTQFVAKKKISTRVVPDYPRI